MTAATLALLLSLVSPTIDEADAIQTPPTVAMTHEERQTMIHGAGGCTPNFSTGGCL